MIGWQLSNVKPAVADATFTPLFGSNFGDFPSDINVLRQSISIKNTTVNQNVAGLVRFVSLPQALEFEYGSVALSNTFSPAFVNELFSIHDSHPNVVTMTANKAAEEGLKMISVPASMVGYNNYYNYTNLAATDYANIRTALSAGADAHSMNTILMFLPNTSTAQAVEITLRSQLRCRYPANSTLASLQKDFAKAKAAAWENVLAKAISMGQTTVTTEGGSGR